jgi:mono/diheme cytochrome c family protein
MGMAVSSDGAVLYVAAMGSGKVGVFDTAELENDSFVPDAADQVPLSAKGPTGLVLDETNGFLFVLTRFNNSVAVIDTTLLAEMESYTLHNPEPASVVNGRPFLYDADYTSANGESSCASCHVGADKDELSWDLGDPLGSVLNNPNPFTFGPFGDPDFSSMKGPMSTQTFRGMAGHGAMHWRGDRTGGNDPGGDPKDEDAAFKQFNPAFVGLLGRANTLTAEEMQAFADFALELTPPPNPIRPLDDSLTAMQEAGQNVFFNLSAGVNTCHACHRLDPTLGFFGTNGNSAINGQPQRLKVPQLRNIYEKVGMFGMPDTRRFDLDDNGSKGDQIRGFGFFHDGSVDTVDRILHAPVQFKGFSAGQTGEDERDAVEQFVFALDSNLKPVVGQQVTLASASGDDVDTRVDLLVARAAAGDADLVVKGNVGSEPRGWIRQNDGSFKSDKSAEPPLTVQDLRALALNLENELTFTAVPVGSGERIGIDRDLDTVLDADDNCQVQVNLNQGDSDNDGIGNACDANICHPD